MEKWKEMVLFVLFAMFAEDMNLVHYSLQNPH